MKLPTELREKLKIPLGKLIPDKETTKENISKLITNNSILVTVGDATTQKMLDYRFIPSIQIVDGQEKRVKRQLPKEIKTKTNLFCDNPAGEITDGAIDMIKKAFQSKFPVRITINGEEDLLVIPVCIYAPEGSLVLYGQPNEGLVIVKIDSAIKNKTKSILNSMT